MSTYKEDARWIKENLEEIKRDIEQMQATLEGHKYKTVLFGIVGGFVGASFSSEILKVLMKVI